MARIDTTATPPADFDALTRAAEEAAGVPSDQEYYAEFLQPPAEEPPVDAVEIVTDAPQEPEPEPETEPVPEEEQVVEAEAKPLLAGKYASVEELEKAYTEAQQAIGRKNNEVGEMRQLLEEFQGLRADLTATPPLRIDEQTVSWFDDMALQNPADAAIWAAEQKQPLLYDRAIRTWYDQDPVAAGRFERQQEQRQLVEAIQGQIAPQVQAAQHVAQRDELQTAMDAVAGRHEDFAQVVGTLTEQRAAEIVQGGFPEQVLTGLTGSQKQKEEVFETLYRWVKAEQAGQLVQAAQEAKTVESEEARAMKIGASVASANTTSPPPVQETEAERQQRVWAQERPSLRDTWQGRDSRRSG